MLLRFWISPCTADWRHVLALHAASQVPSIRVYDHNNSTIMLLLTPHSWQDQRRTYSRTMTADTAYQQLGRV